ncbi:polyadenylate-binding protein-interacting protein 2B-like [Saccoglossus kowalevskii]|uniref:Polyadenylate-binding protein-interacting protein 2B-like n=1 Tax=Saccoglossus kowalevskii TaxID=10224 RepID=A0ABM0GVF1_SACKO|nr:PREDICTED: polyadenylate-binding protein-interacting protein 2B-like [Saccoglossus kowalevskii]
MKGPIEVVNSQSMSDINMNNNSNITSTLSMMTMNPFEEYLWMAEVEEFDKKVLEELQEEEFMEACMEEMLLEEEADWYYPEGENGNIECFSLMENISGLSVMEKHDEETPDS